MQMPPVEEDAPKRAAPGGSALLSAPVLAEPRWVGGATQFRRWCLHLGGQQRHRNAPKTGASARGRGWRGAAAGERAHTGRVAAAGNSTRKIKKKRTPAPTQSPECKMSFCKTQICARPRAQRNGSPSVRLRTRHHRVFRSCSRGETAAPHLPNLPRHQRERGWEWASLVFPSPRKASGAPKQKSQTNEQKRKTNKQKNPHPKHCYHRLI